MLTDRDYKNQYQEPASEGIMKSADVQREGGQCTAALDLIHPHRQGVEATSFNLLCGPKKRDGILEYADS